MTKVSWITTLSPLVLALATTIKAFVVEESLTPEEIELIKWLVLAFLGSGGIGAFLKSQKK